MKAAAFIKAAAFAALTCQFATAQDQRVNLTQGTAGSWTAEWNGVADQTDFVQWSLDLQDWHFMPIVEHGAGLKSYGFLSSSDKFFIRLEPITWVTTDAEHEDYDYDGLNNIDEVNLYDTDPLSWDTDGDGLSDAWEIENHLDPRDDGSIDPNNGANGDPDGDGLTNLSEFYWGADPHASDTDGDGLSDGDEVLVHHSYPTSIDSDGDGLTDAQEVFTYGTSPILWDTDGDWLSDGDEITLFGTDPTLFDTDGDWLPDDWELDHGFDPNNAADGFLDADGDGLANNIEYVFMDQGYDPFVANSAVGFPWSEDPDLDGLTTADEFNLYHTNPRQPDTDDDGMEDGWEIQYGFPATLHNSRDSNPNNDEHADPDNDGLDNAAESQYGTNPLNADTDGDGFNDFAEAQGASNPTNPASTPTNPGGTPGGPANPPPPIVPVQVNFGDHSGSHSEKYRVTLEPIEGDTNTQKRYRTNRHYGETQVDTFNLPAGSRYKVTLKHIATDPKYRDTPKPDFDYTLEIPQLPASANTIRILKDPQGMMGVHDESDSFFATGKNADLFVMRFKTETISTTPQNRDRKKLGVREESEVTVKPTSAGTLNWSLQNQKDATVVPATGYSVLFTADTRTKDPTLRATFDTGDTYDIVWNVVQPTGERARKTADLNYPAGTQGAGMTLEYTTLPDDVSFYKVEVLEVDKGTSNVSGFFSAFGGSALQHQPNPNWVTLSQANMWNDTAAFYGWGFSPSSGQTPAWAYGTYQWDIDVMWRTVGEGGNGLLLGNRTQLHTLHDSTGRSTESKSGESSSRTP